MGGPKVCGLQPDLAGLQRAEVTVLLQPEETAAWFLAIGENGSTGCSRLASESPTPSPSPGTAVVPSSHILLLVGQVLRNATSQSLPPLTGTG